jgi:CRISPR-associated endonuclease/helicase Cas3
MAEPIARLLIDDQNIAHKQPLTDHLIQVAKLAEKFSSKWGSENWGFVAGLLHDHGKDSTLWQNYLEIKSGYKQAPAQGATLGKIPHAIYGAAEAESLFPGGKGRMLAYCISGHHAGLPDWSSADEEGGKASLEYQLSQAFKFQRLSNKDYHFDNYHLEPPNIQLSSNSVILSLWIRMLFSALVDADYLDTERFMKPAESELRGKYLSIQELLEIIFQDNENLDSSSPNTPINAVRRNVRARCLQYADRKPGVFSLSVPTGGGKTLSSMNFALAHANKHNKERIIYVMPFLSIIEQNAGVFKRVFGDDQVVEHHSNIEENDKTTEARLAAENWDAPIIVTTAVQFYESLFSASPGRCRKLHNIANSVIVLDEAHMVPLEYLAPILETLRALVDYFGVTLLLSTATQPALAGEISGHKTAGFDEVTEIMGTVEDVNRLYKALERCEIQMRKEDQTVSSWEEIADELQDLRQVLCIVSDRKSCRYLHSLMPKDTYHLSALMCPEHRSQSIKEIIKKLENNEEVRVISTQLIEAGVDVDFPVVYRAFAGLDSIIQAAGRCNREGKLKEKGKVIVFNTASAPPIGLLRKAAQATSKIIRPNQGMPDVFDPKIIEQFYGEYYSQANSLDENQILPLLNPLMRDGKNLDVAFRTASRRFRVIDNELMKTIFVPHEGEKNLIQALIEDPFNHSILRSLQRYSVSIYEHDFFDLYRRGALREVMDGTYALMSSTDYDKHVGLLLNTDEHNPESYFQDGKEGL